MAATSHLLRRGAVYYWRRKVPRALVACANRKHLLISLRTWSPLHARSLAIQLDALIEDLIVMAETRFLSQVQLDGMLREVLLKHLAKLDRVAAVAKLRGFDRLQAERDDRRTGWVYRLLDAHGPNAHVSDADRAAILADGLAFPRFFPWRDDPRPGLGGGLDDAGRGQVAENQLTARR